jgi:hypothetical protein
MKALTGLPDNRRGREGDIVKDDFPVALRCVVVAEYM